MGFKGSRVRIPPSRPLITKDLAAAAYGGSFRSWPPMWPQRRPSACCVSLPLGSPVLLAACSAAEKSQQAQILYGEPTSSSTWPHTKGIDAIFERCSRGSRVRVRPFGFEDWNLARPPCRRGPPQKRPGRRGTHRPAWRALHWRVHTDGRRWRSARGGDGAEVLPLREPPRIRTAHDGKGRAREVG